MKSAATSAASGCLQMVCIGSPFVGFPVRTDKQSGLRAGWLSVRGERRGWLAQIGYRNVGDATHCCTGEIRCRGDRSLRKSRLDVLQRVRAMSIRSCAATPR
jgi:hypothetical protein